MPYQPGPPGTLIPPALPGLSGTGRVADDVWLLAHHDQAGKPLLRRRVLGIAVAAGLHAELLLAGSITLAADGTVSAHRRPAPDPLTGGLHQMIAADPGGRQVRDWLLYASRPAAGAVAVRLASSGFLIQTRGQVLWRPARYRPAHPDWAFSAVVRASRARDAHGAILSALARACGLGWRLTAAGNPAARSTEEISRLIPGTVRDLIGHAQAAADSVILSPS